MKKKAESRKVISGKTIGKKSVNGKNPRGYVLWCLMAVCLGLWLSGCGAANGNRADAINIGNAAGTGDESGIWSMKSKSEDTADWKERGGILEGVERYWAEDSDGPEGEWFYKCLQNGWQGNRMAYDDGYYYFRSQSDYSLCRSEGAGKEVEVLADQIPGEIYVRDGNVFFTNVSDGCRLYRGDTHGGGWEKVSDFPVWNMVIMGDEVYFRSAYHPRCDRFGLQEEEGTGSYLYSMSLSGTDSKMLAAETCTAFTTDGKFLYYLSDLEIFRCGLDGNHKEKVGILDNPAAHLMVYRGNLYLLGQGEDNSLMRMELEKTEEAGVKATPVLSCPNAKGFTFSNGVAFLFLDREIKGYRLETGELLFRVCQPEETETDLYREKPDVPWLHEDRGLFLVNGQLFTRLYDSPEKGVLWFFYHGKEQDGNHFSVFEDVEAIASGEFVSDSSIETECMFYCPGKSSEGAAEFLDGELYGEAVYVSEQDGKECGTFSVLLPKFADNIEGSAAINRKLERLFEECMAEKDSFFERLEAEENTGWHGFWECSFEYRLLYVGERYVSMFFCERGAAGGSWEDAHPMTFDRYTGEQLSMDDLFSVEPNVYKKRLFGAVYKYMEKNGYYSWGSMERNVLEKQWEPDGFYLTPDGIVLCYGEYTIGPGSWDTPRFEIPYARFADLLKQGNDSELIAERWSGKRQGETYWTVAVDTQGNTVSLQDLEAGESLMLVYEKDGEKKVLQTYRTGEDYNEPAEFTAEVFQNLLGHDGVCIYENFWGNGYLTNYYAVEEGRLVDLAQSWTLPDGWANGNVNNPADLDGDGKRELVCNVMYLADGGNSVIVYKYDGQQVWCGDGWDLVEEPYEEFPANTRGAEYLPEEKAVRFWFKKTPEDTGYTERCYPMDLDKIEWEPYPF